MRFTFACLSVLLFFTALLCGAFAQDNPTGASVTCNFDEQKQVVIQYEPVTINAKKPIAGQVPFGKVWAPGGKPMTLFTNTPVQVGSRVLGVGAYTIFVIPTSKQWTLIVSKSTDMSGAHNDQDDLVRAPMDSGELPNPEASFSVGFEHAGAGQCNLRLDLDKYGHFVTFQEK
jgi:Protein of unknown function (DUF2911)